jgi:hypothetical protein
MNPTESFVIRVVLPKAHLPRHTTNGPAEKSPDLPHWKEWLAWFERTGLLLMRPGFFVTQPITLQERGWSKIKQEAR